MSNARAGIASLTIDGSNFDVVGDLRYNPATVKREMLIGQSGPQGHKVSYVNGFISAKLRDANGLTVRDFQDMTDVTVVGVLVSGKTVSGAGLTQTNELDVDTMEATFDVKFEGWVEEG